MDENALKLVALFVLPTDHIDPVDDTEIEIPEDGADSVTRYIFKNPGNAHAGRIDREGIEVNSRSHFDNVVYSFCLP